jgi:hypothetical protein
MNLNTFKLGADLIPPMTVGRATVFAHKIAFDTRTFTNTHISILRDNFGAIEKVDPCGPSFTKLREEVSTWAPVMLAQVAGADIKWLSYLARKQIEQNKTAAV